MGVVNFKFVANILHGIVEVTNQHVVFKLDEIVQKVNSTIVKHKL